jgi:hypothetical protein
MYLQTKAWSRHFTLMLFFCVDEIESGTEYNDSSLNVLLLGKRMASRSDG